MLSRECSDGRVAGLDGRVRGGGCSVRDDSSLYFLFFLNIEPDFGSGCCHSIGNILLGYPEFWINSVLKCDKV